LIVFIVLLLHSFHVTSKGLLPLTLAYVTNVAYCRGVIVVWNDTIY